MKTENVTVENVARTQHLKVVINIEGQSVGSHYIEGILYHTWDERYKSKYNTLESFLKNILFLDVININSRFRTNDSKSLYDLYVFLDEFYKFKKTYNIRYGNAYGNNHQ